MIELSKLQALPAVLKISNPLHLSMPLLPTKISRLAWPCAEASCSSAVRVARDLVSDVGEAVAARSGGLLELARSSINNAERDSRKVLVKRCRLSLEPYVPLSELKCGPTEADGVATEDLDAVPGGQEIVPHSVWFDPAR